VVDGWLIGWFPTLFPMAKSFLGCRATTAELERVFSKAGKLHDDQHKSVQDVTLEQQLFGIQLLLQLEVLRWHFGTHCSHGP
jgi:hypothetical protein